MDKFIGIRIDTLEKLGAMSKEGLFYSDKLEELQKRGGIYKDNQGTYKFTLGLSDLTHKKLNNYLHKNI